jgi:hypothetical protein
MLDTWKSHAYSGSILISALVVRAILGISRPQMDLSGSVIVGATTVMLLAPLLHRLIFERTMLASRRQQAGYVATTTVCLASFGYVLFSS